MEDDAGIWPPRRAPDNPTAEIADDPLEWFPRALLSEDVFVMVGPAREGVTGTNFYLTSTQRERLAAALEGRGEKRVPGRSGKYWTYTRARGGTRFTSTTCRRASSKRPTNSRTTRRWPRNASDRARPAPMDKAGAKGRLIAARRYVAALR